MKVTHDKIIGIGGIFCRCCRDASKKETRIAVNRISRRKNKIELKKNWL